MQGFYWCICTVQYCYFYLSKGLEYFFHHWPHLFKWYSVVETCDKANVCGCGCAYRCWQAVCLCLCISIIHNSSRNLLEVLRSTFAVSPAVCIARINVRRGLSCLEIKSVKLDGCSDFICSDWLISNKPRMDANRFRQPLERTVQ